MVIVDVGDIYHSIDKSFLRHSDGDFVVVITSTRVLNAQKPLQRSIKISINGCSEFLFEHLFNLFAFRKINEVVHIEAEIDGWGVGGHSSNEDAW